ncbi:MAG TPA: hypothetical protein PLA43_11000 [Bryobacteraceae bacterium]|nr:hypothetical protein [Bryobacteraceae bacterium]HPU72475.1 hypothetical protein [Bryobacteraceae bacterium]
MRDLIIAYDLVSNTSDYDYARFFEFLHKLGAHPLNGSVWLLKNTSYAIGLLHAELTNLLSPRDHLLVALINGVVSTK